MYQQSTTETSPALNKVKSAFEGWRANKVKGRRIPQELWEDAIALYPEFSIGKIATSLSLSYTDLKERVTGKIEKKSSLSKKHVPTFMELDFSSATCPQVSECVVEMEDGKGGKMKMCFRGKTDFDLLELGKSFWMR